MKRVRNNNANLELRLGKLGSKQPGAAAKKLRLAANAAGMSVNKILEGRTLPEAMEFTKLAVTRGASSYPSKLPTFSRVGGGGMTNIDRTMMVNVLQNAARHWGTPSVWTGSLGSILETLAVGYAAKKSGVEVLYWEDKKYFPGSGPGSGTTFCGGPTRAKQDVEIVMDAVRQQARQGKGVILLKTVIDTRPLYSIENNNNRKNGWARVFFNATEPSALSSAARTILKTKNSLTYNDIPSIYGIVKPRPAKNSPWKGYWNAEPDGIFFEMRDGNLYIDVIEFKITQGKVEGVPAEAWQMAKVKRMLEYFFQDYDPIIRTNFCPWQYGTGVGQKNVNFRNPYEVKNSAYKWSGNKGKFDELYRNSFGNNSTYKPRVLLPGDFESRTGIRASIAQKVVEAFERGTSNNLRFRLAHVVRHSRVSGSASKGVRTVRSIGPNAPGVASKNRAAAQMTAKGAVNMVPNCTKGEYGLDNPAIVIRCSPVLGPAEYDDIIRSTQRLGWLRGWAGVPGATEEQVRRGLEVVKKMAGSTKPPQLYSSANLNTRRDVLRLKAWRDRISASNFNENSVNNLRAPYLLALRWVEPSNETVSSIISRVTQNASALMPQNVPYILKFLRNKGVNNTNTYKRVFNTQGLASNNVFKILVRESQRGPPQSVLARYVNNLTSRKNTMQE